METLLEVVVMQDDIYTQTGVEDMFEDDNLTSEEAGFMRGYLEAGQNV